MDNVGFEIRSIQEFFAARRIASGPDEALLHRLEATLESVHWRNTWLFAAGRAFIQREHIRLDILGLLAEVDNRDQLRMVTAPGADLALDLLIDEVASQSPSVQRTLYKSALGLLNLPPDNDLVRRARILVDLADRDSHMRVLLNEATKLAARGEMCQLKSAEIVLEGVRRGTSASRFFAPRLREIQLELRHRTGSSEEVATQPLPYLISTHAPELKLDASVEDALVQVANIVDNAESSSDATTVSGLNERLIPSSLLDDLMSDSRLANLLAEFAMTAYQGNLQKGTLLRRSLKSWLQRRPVDRGVLRSAIAGAK
jgi:hypothetical protein